MGSLKNIYKEKKTKEKFLRKTLEYKAELLKFIHFFLLQSLISHTIRYE